MHGPMPCLNACNLVFACKQHLVHVLTLRLHQSGHYLNGAHFALAAAGWRGMMGPDTVEGITMVQRIVALGCATVQGAFLLLQSCQAGVCRMQEAPAPAAALLLNPHSAQHGLCWPSLRLVQPSKPLVQAAGKLYRLLVQRSLAPACRMK